MATLLIIFAKEPRPGQVKTRLSPPLTPVAAAGLYQCFLEDALETATSLPGVTLALAFTPDGARGYFQSLAPEGTWLFPQAGADLGERMDRAFEGAFAAGFQKVLLWGTDTPDLPAAVLLEAKEALAAGRAEVVLGPTADGGYYLVGLSSPQPELFRRITWSAATVLAQTLAAARRQGLAVHLLPEWPDLDTYADLVALVNKPAPAPGPGWRSRRLARRLLLPLP